ncbi:hypothetical protein Tco_0271845 [Tanacetum coccineum]
MNGYSSPFGLYHVFAASAAANTFVNHLPAVGHSVRSARMRSRSVTGGGVVVTGGGVSVVTGLGPRGSCGLPLGGPFS